MWKGVALSILLVISNLFAATALDDEDRFSRDVQFYRSGKKVARQMSDTLDNLVNPNVYDKRIRPLFGKKSLEIEINLSLNSIGPVDEKTQSFYLDCYFRQSWVDSRLQFNTSGVYELSLDWKILNLIWKPDTFFLNGKKSKLHKITVPNRFSRIYPSGQVTYSQRLTIHARCGMNLRKFPLDSQKCPLFIGSYGYPAEDLTYKWKERPLSMADDMSMSQFLLLSWSHGQYTNISNRKLETGFRNDSVAFLHFIFERQTGYFLLQIYTPLFLMVACSWVAFWIVKTDVPGRCGLGVTTALSVAKIGFVGGASPQVPYATAMDIFVAICFISVFASLIEFAVINFLGVFIGRYKKWESEEKELQKKALEELQLKKAIMKEVKKKEKEAKKKGKEEAKKREEEKDKTQNNSSPSSGKVPLASIEADYIDEGGSEVITDEEDEVEPKTDRQLVTMVHLYSKAYKERVNLERHTVWEKIEDFLFRRFTLLVSFFTLKPIHQTMIYSDTDLTLDLIDQYSRIYFPGVFMTMMLIYWTTYIYLL